MNEEGVPRLTHARFDSGSLATAVHRELFEQTVRLPRLCVRSVELVNRNARSTPEHARRIESTSSKSP